MLCPIIIDRLKLDITSFPTRVTSPLTATATRPWNVVRAPDSSAIAAFAGPVSLPMVIGSNGACTETRLFLSCWL
ncbi:hypothetical protein RSAG8_12334, partial [Rhizoctonia solani AG-8 WAC10335]